MDRLAVADLEDPDDPHGVIDLVEQAIISDSNAVAFAAGQLLCPGGSRLGVESHDDVADPFDHLLR
jgi:hypothetical protein